MAATLLTKCTPDATQQQVIPFIWSGRVALKIRVKHLQVKGSQAEVNYSGVKKPYFNVKR